MSNPKSIFRRDLLKKFIMTVPLNKISVFGGAYTHVELSYQNILDSTGMVNEEFFVLRDTNALKVFPNRILVKKILHGKKEV